MVHEQHRLLAIAPLPLALAAPPLPVDARDAEGEPPVPLEISKDLVDKFSGSAVVDHEFSDASPRLAPLLLVAELELCPAEKAGVARGRGGRRGLGWHLLFS